MEYFTFPMETLNVTQNYLGTASHLEHTTGDPKDYPIDIAGIDQGQSAVFARVPLKVVAKRGIGNSSVTNTVWLETENPVITPTFEDYAWLTLTHWNDGDIAMKKWSVGMTIPAGSIICYEGRDGASANHIHLVCGRGKCSSWQENSKGKWVMSGLSLPPEQVLFIDSSFTTTIKNKGNLDWKNLPRYIGTPVEKDDTKDQLGVLVNKLNVRVEPTTASDSLGYINLGIYDYDEVRKDDTYTWYHTPVGWIADKGGWLIIYPKKEEENMEIEELKKQVAELEQEKENLVNQIVEKDTTIKELEDKLKNYDLDLGTLSTFTPNEDGYYYFKLTTKETLLYKIETE